MRWLLIILLFAGCRRDHKPVSFYYWKTKFTLNQFEKEVLKEQRVEQLYVRYFDIDFFPDQDKPIPVSPIDIGRNLPYNIIPVVYIKNRTFERLDTTGVRKLAESVQALIAAIHRAPVQEVQFDCDWTESTKDKYFQFLRQYKDLTQQLISATIRMHQVKYRHRTGVPPVERGVLMYYNMAGINPNDVNSIYEKGIANRYNEWIRYYPIPLDVALPIFSWGYTYRDGRIVNLLNKFNFTYFKNDSTFTPAGKNKLVAREACFKAGYYFHQHDTVKLEQVSEKDLVDIAKQIKNNAGRSIDRVIFFDLDSSNIVQYEKDIFEKVMDNID